MARFLLCDDDVPLSRGVARLLAPFGVVDVRHTVDAAHEVLGTNSWTAAIFDVRFGDDYDGGLRLLTAARAHDPAMPIAVITGRIDHDTLNAASDNAAVYLPKPVSHQRILAFARRALSQQLSVRDRLAAETEVWRTTHGLTLTEAIILRDFATGCSRTELAERMDVSPLTIKKHASNLVQKTGDRSLDRAAQRLLLAVAVTPLVGSPREHK